MKIYRVLLLVTMVFVEISGNVPSTYTIKTSSVCYGSDPDCTRHALACDHVTSVIGLFQGVYGFKPLGSMCRDVSACSMVDPARCCAKQKGDCEIKFRETDIEALYGNCSGSTECSYNAPRLNAKCSTQSYRSVSVFSDVKYTCIKENQLVTLGDRKTIVGDQVYVIYRPQVMTKMADEVDCQCLILSTNTSIIDIDIFALDIRLNSTVEPGCTSVSFIKGSNVLKEMSCSSRRFYHSFEYILRTSTPLRAKVILNKKTLPTNIWFGFRGLNGEVTLSCSYVSRVLDPQTSSYTDVTTRGAEQETTFMSLTTDDSNTRTRANKQAILAGDLRTTLSTSIPISTSPTLKKSREKQPIPHHLPTTDKNTHLTIVPNDISLAVAKPTENLSTSTGTSLPSPVSLLVPTGTTPRVVSASSTLTSQQTSTNSTPVIHTTVTSKLINKQFVSSQPTGRLNGNTTLYTEPDSRPDIKTLATSATTVHIYGTDTYTKLHSVQINDVTTTSYYIKPSGSADTRDANQKSNDVNVLGNMFYTTSDDVYTPYDDKYPQHDDNQNITSGNVKDVGDGAETIDIKFVVVSGIFGGCIILVTSVTAMYCYARLKAKRERQMSEIFQIEDGDKTADHAYHVIDPACVTETAKNVREEKTLSDSSEDPQCLYSQIDDSRRVSDTMYATPNRKSNSNSYRSVSRYNSSNSDYYDLEPETYHSECNGVLNTDVTDDGYNYLNRHKAVATSGNDYESLPHPIPKLRTTNL